MAEPIWLRIAESKYRLRSLTIAALALPPLLGGAVLTRKPQ
jgi:hypothetical protein